MNYIQRNGHRWNPNLFPAPCRICNQTVPAKIGHRIHHPKKQTGEWWVFHLDCLERIGGWYNPERTYT